MELFLIPLGEAYSNKKSGNSQRWETGGEAWEGNGNRKPGGDGSEETINRVGKGGGACENVSEHKAVEGQQPGGTGKSSEEQRDLGVARRKEGTEKENLKLISLVFG